MSSISTRTSATLGALQLATPLTIAEKRAFNEHVRRGKAHEVAGEYEAALAAYACARMCDETNAQLPRKMEVLQLRLARARAVAATDDTCGHATSNENVAPPLPTIACATTGVDAHTHTHTHAGRAFDVRTVEAPAPETRRMAVSLLTRPAAKVAARSAATLFAHSDSDGEEGEGTACRVRGDMGEGSDEDALLSLAQMRGAHAGAPQRAQSLPAQSAPCAAPASAGAFVVNDAEAAACLPGGFAMPLALYEKLFDYQRAGVAWMWSLHKRCPLPTGSLGRGHASEGAAWEGAAPARVLTGTGSRRPALHDAHVKHPGGILADDMGLGKTVVTIAYIAGLFHAELANAVLIVAPVSIVPVWEAEFRAWAPQIRVRTFHGVASNRDSNIASIMRKGGVLITTYGMVTNNPDLLGGDAAAVKAYWQDVGGARDGEDGEGGGGALGRSISGPRSARKPRAPRTPCGLATDATVEWDAAILDEGHKIKNPSTQIAKAIRLLPAEYRLLLTGTPLQNNMDELWALFDYICAGQLLGTRRRFNHDIANVILRSRDKHATAVERLAGQGAYEMLATLIQPHMLRREKARLQAAARAQRGLGPAPMVSATGLAGTHSLGAPASASTPPLSMFDRLASKKELVLWISMAPAQVDLYRAFLSSSAVQKVLNESESPLAAIAVLRNITCHPLLLGAAFREAMHASAGSDAAALADAEADEEELTQGRHPRVRTGAVSAAQLWNPQTLPPAPELIALSGKLQLLVRLVSKLLLADDKVLVFSQSRRMLDILEACLRASAGAAAIARIDGTLNVDERRRVVEAFNTGSALRVCLLTTGVGAHGLTLTSANRVIMFDPSWNPAVDSQAVDRAYRVGQTRDVITYRLISCGTVEEAMYRLQVFKAGMSSSVMAAASSAGMSAETRRLLSRDDLRQILVLGDIHASATKGIIDAIADPPDITSSAVAEHLRQLGDWVGPACTGISHHDCLFNLSETDRERFAEATRALGKRGHTSGRLHAPSRRSASPLTTPGNTDLVTPPLPPRARTRQAVLDEVAAMDADAPGACTVLATPTDDGYGGVIDLTSSPAGEAVFQPSPALAPRSDRSSPQYDENPLPPSPAFTMPLNANDEGGHEAVAPAAREMKPDGGAPSPALDELSAALEAVEHALANAGSVPVHLQVAAMLAAQELGWLRAAED